jgi:hypothetical protein
VSDVEYRVFSSADTEVGRYTITENALGSPCDGTSAPAAQR